jgi:predicted Zn finger-like uncharacterized protein
MSQEERAAEAARRVCAAHGGLTEVGFLRKNDFSMLVFGDGTAALAKSVCELLTFGYTGTGPRCYRAFLEEAGFAKCDVEDIGAPLRRKKDGTKVRDEARGDDCVWADGQTWSFGRANSPAAAPSSGSKPAPQTVPCGGCGQMIPKADLTCKKCGHADWGPVIGGTVTCLALALACFGAALFWFELAFWKWACYAVGALFSVCLVWVAHEVLAARRARRARQAPTPPATVKGSAPVPAPPKEAAAMRPEPARKPAPQQPPPAAPAEPPAEFIRLACPQCGARLRVKAAQAGRKVKCPKCGHGVTATAALSAAAPARTEARPLTLRATRRGVREGQRAVEHLVISPDGRFVAASTGV